MRIANLIRMVGLFTTIVSQVKGFIEDVSNELKIEDITHDKPVVIAIRKDNNVDNPDQHVLPLDDKGNKITIFSQEFVNKTIDIAKHSVKIFEDVDKAFNLALITLKGKEKVEQPKEVVENPVVTEILETDKTETKEDKSTKTTKTK